jgi:hypothetical protein
LESQVVKRPTMIIKVAMLRCSSPFVPLVNDRPDRRTLADSQGTNTIPLQPVSPNASCTLHGTDLLWVRRAARSAWDEPGSRNSQIGRRVHTLKQSRSSRPRKPVNSCFIRASSARRRSAATGA